MPKASPGQVAFNAGQLAESFEGRVDHDRYATGVKVLRNLVPQVQGPALKRPGTRYVSETFGGSTSRLLPFRFSTVQSYTIEMAGGTARVFAGGVQDVDTDAGIIVWPTGELDIIDAQIGIVTAGVVTVTYDTMDPDIRLQDGLSVWISSVGGMIELIDGFYTVTNLNEVTGEFDLDGVDGTGWTPYTSGGTVGFGSLVGSPVTFVIPYNETEVAKLQFAQSADVLYLAHQDVPPQKIERREHYLWKCSTIAFKPPPFQEFEASDVDHPWLYADSATNYSVAADGGSPSAIVGTIVQAHLVAKDVFSPDMIGQALLLGMKDGPRGYLPEWRGNWNFQNANAVLQTVNGYMRVEDRVWKYNSGSTGVNHTGYITPYSETPGTNASDGNWTWDYVGQGQSWGIIRDVRIRASAPPAAPPYYEAVVEVMGLESLLQTARWDPFTLTTSYSTPDWALGEWSAERGYPGTVTFYEDRLWWAGSLAKPQTLWGSRIGDYENHDTDDTAESAQSWTINDEQVNRIEWMTSSGVLTIGTSGGEFVAQGQNPDQAISGENPLHPVRNSQYGSKSGIPPLRAEDVVLFVQRAGLKVREFVYQFESDRYVAPDLTILAEEITFSGIKAWAYQQEPQRTIWVVLEDGSLRTFTYERAQNVVGWAEQQFGGTDVRVLSVATIPHPRGTPGDQVWFVVERTVNGTTRRYIEVLEEEWKKGIDQASAYYVDSGLTQDVRVTFADLVSAFLLSEETLVVGLHTLPNGTLVRFSGLTAPTLKQREAGEVAWYDLLEGRTFQTFDVGGVQFLIRDKDSGIAVDSSSVTIPFDGEGYYRIATTAFSGLGHLEGETVTVLGDGSVQPPQVVAGGAITLDRPAAHVHVGLPYDATLRTMRMNAGGADGVSQGKIVRIKGVVFRVLNSGGGFHYGPVDFLPEMDEVNFRDADDLMDLAATYMDGDTRRLPWPSGYEMEAAITIRHTTPLPFTLAGIFPQLTTEDA